MTELSDVVEVVYNVIRNGKGRCLLYCRKDEDIWEPMNEVIGRDDHPLLSSKHMIKKNSGKQTDIGKVKSFKSFEFKQNDTNFTVYLFLYTLHIGKITFDKERYDALGWFSSFDARKKINWNEGFRRSLDRITRYPC